MNGLNELKSLEHSVIEYIKKADEKMMIHSDNLVLKIGENTSKFISAAMINRETFRPFKNYCKGKIFP